VPDHELEDGTGTQIAMAREGRGELKG
jgi:hypothetical protein